MLHTAKKLLKSLVGLTEVRPTDKPQSRARQRGMTLIEIMVVLAIIGLVVGVVGVNLFGRFGKAQEQVAKTQMERIGEALHHYKLEHRSYPSTAEGLGSLTVSKSGAAPIMESVPKDPWGNDYVYIYPGTRNTGSYDLISYGADGSSGGGDDVGNWADDKTD